MSSFNASNAKKQRTAPVTCNNTSRTKKLDDKHEISDEDIDDGDENDDDDEDDSEDDEEDEEGDDITKLPRMFYEYALEQLEDTEIVHTTESYHKIIATLKKSRDVMLESNEDLKTLLEKANKRKAGDTKVPPGSALVQRDINDKRFLLCLVNILLSKIYHLQYNSTTTTATLKEALIWFPRSIEANYLMGEELRGNAINDNVLNQCETFYVKAVDTGAQLQATKSAPTSSSQLQQHLNAKLNNSDVGSAGGDADVNEEDTELNQLLLADELCAYKKATQSLILFYCQSGRNNEAYKYLTKNGYKLKLSNQVLQYPINITPTTTSTNNSEASQYVSIIDNAVDSNILTHLRSVFRPQSPFWSEHHYDTLSNASKTVGYFSYIYPMKDRSAKCSIEQVIDRIYPLVCQQFPAAREATIAEWWVHSRPHINGHQLHFDSDETRIQTGAGKVQHPIVSCVLFVTADVGGPTLVTNQQITGELASKGWLASPKSNRLVTFDANYLHGVIPGRDVNPSTTLNNSSAASVEERRLTFMIGFWKSISAKNRGKDSPGPGQPFPNPSDTRYSWPHEMSMKTELSYSSDSGSGVLKFVAPLEISTVWESIESGVDASVIAERAAVNNNNSSSRSNGGRDSANYNTCFQGF